MISLWDHQVKGIELAIKEPNVGLFFDPGLGKTATAINILRMHYQRNKCVVPTLIFAPIVVLNQWKDEFKRHSKIPEHVIFAITGSNRHLEIKAAIERTRNCIIITNYESATQDKSLIEFLNWKPEILIIDESHRCKTPSAKRSKKITMIADRAKHKYILTGTPITNSAMDIFQQFRILDGGETFGDNFFVFRHEWFEDANASWKGRSNYFPKFEIKLHKIQEMNKLIYKKAIRAIKSECLDLPPFIKTKIEVEMSLEQKRMYEEMRKDFITFINSDHSNEPQAIIANQAVTKALRMQQIVTGFCKTESGVNVRINKNPRIEALEELLEDLTLSHKVIVWACFKENYEQIRESCRRLKLGYAELHGETIDRNANINAFRNDHNCRVLIANQGAGGVGVNLIEASYSIYYSKTFSLEHDIQSEARNYRGGSEIHDKITRIDLVAPQTIDDVINQALEKKQDLVKNIIDLAKMI